MTLLTNPAPARIRVLLADDHRIVREGLGALLRQQDDFDLVGEAEDGLAAVKLARTLRPDVVVTDVSMPGLNGVEAIRRIHKDEPATKVLCLSVHDETSMVLSVIDAGAAGYVLKDASFEELVRAIRQVMTERIYLSPSLVGIFVHKYRSRDAQPPAESPLTAREREVVQLFSEGYSSTEIATRLHVSAKTVATHREHILAKLHMRSIAELTRYAIREGLTSLDAPCRVAPKGRSMTAAVQDV
jgi:DNA-binding NarL/FixJ family response regulator